MRRTNFNDVCISLITNTTMFCTIVVFLFFVILLCSNASAVQVSVSNYKNVNVSLNEDYLSVFVDGSSLLSVNKSNNFSSVYSVGGVNTTDVVANVVQVNVQNITQNVSCPFNVTMFNDTFVLLQNVSDRINNSWFEQQFKKTNNDLQDFFYTNMKPVNDKLLECGKELNDLKLQKDSCLINASFFNNEILSCQHEQKDAWTLTSVVGIACAVLLIVLVALLFMITNRNSLKDIKQNIMKK